MLRWQGYELSKRNQHMAPLVDVRVKVFSDSILIYSENAVVGELMYEADTICAALIDLYNYAFLRYSWLIRGAMALGEVHAVDDEIFFGKDLVRAYEAEQNQDWAAICVIDKTSIMYNPTSLFTNDYNIPFKTGARRDTVLNLFVGHGTELDFMAVRGKLVALQRQRRRNASVRRKLENTLDLFDFLISKNVTYRSTIEEADPETFALSMRISPHHVEQLRMLGFEGGPDEALDFYRKALAWAAETGPEIS